MALVSEVSNQALSRTQRYLTVRSLTERLAEPLSAEDQTVQSMPDVSPTKWHRAHVTWFFEEFLLRPSLSHYREFHPEFGYLFNSYYEAVGARYPRPQRGLLSRPRIEEIAAYRGHVDAAMGDLLGVELDEAIADLVELGMNHEQQHQELILMDIKHVLGINPLRPSYVEAAGAETPVERPLGWVEHVGGVVEIGHDGGGFAYDNESPRHPVLLQPFALADRPVSCGDWLEFIADEGYSRAELWLSEGWATVQTHGWSAPLYWDRDGSEWQVFTLTGPKAVEPSEPVCHLSYFEADAYARWSGSRLPTEFEWEAACSSCIDPVGAGLDLAVLHPRGTRRERADDVAIGEVWEWTSSAYLPYPGFRPAAGAVGEYNGKFMVNQHVLRGGCCATPRGHVRATYRNFFPPASRWAFSGARLAKDL